MSQYPWALLNFPNCNAALNSSAPNAMISFYSDDPNLLATCGSGRGSLWCCDPSNSSATYRAQGCAGQNLTQAQVRALPSQTPVVGWCQGSGTAAGRAGAAAKAAWAGTHPCPPAGCAAAAVSSRAPMQASWGPSSAAMGAASGIYDSRAWGAAATAGSSMAAAKAAAAAQGWGSATRVSCR